MMIYSYIKMDKWKEQIIQFTTTKRVKGIFSQKKKKKKRLKGTCQKLKAKRW